MYWLASLYIIQLLGMYFILFKHSMFIITFAFYFLLKTLYEEGKKKILAPCIQGEN